MEKARVIYDTNYLRFELSTLSASGKTALFSVKNKMSGVFLGIVSWYSSWRKYTFTATEGCVFDSNCLDDISAFCKAQTIKHKEGV